MTEQERSAPRSAQVGSALAVAALLGLTIWVFAPVVAGRESAVRGDNFLHSGPVHVWLGGVLQEGVFPFWVPEDGLGFPRYAESSNAMLHPLNLALLAVLPAQRAHDLLLVCHFAILALATFSFARALGASQPAALIAATLAAFSPLGLGRAYNSVWIQSVAWSAVVFACFERTMAARATLAPLGLAVAIALLILSGYPPMTHATIAFLGIVLVVRLALDRSFAWRRALGFAAAVASGVALAAIQVVPFAELVAASSRADHVEVVGTVPFLVALRGMWLSNDSALILRGGGVTEGLASPLALVALALAPLCRDPRPLIYLGVAVVSMLVAAGPRSAVYDAAALLLPGVNRLRQTFHFVWVAGAPLAVAVGMIVASADLRGASRAARGAAALTSIGVAWLALQSMAGLTFHPRYVTVAALVLAIAALATAWRMASATASWATSTIAVAVLAQAALLAPGYNRFPPASELTGPSAVASTIARRPAQEQQARVASFPMRLHDAQIRRILFRHALDPPALRAMAYCRDVLCPSLQLLHGITTTEGFHTAPLARRALLQPLLERELRSESAAPPGRRLVDRFDVRFVTVADAERPAQLAPDLARVDGFDREGALLFENRFASGPWQATSDVVVVPDRQSAIQALSAGETAVLVEAPPASDWPAPIQRLVEALPWASERTHLRAHVVSEGAGWVFVPSPVFPGWRARVDGAPGPIHPALLAGKAIPVGPGEHDVELAFLPIGFHLGVLVSATTAIAIAVAAALRARRRDASASRPR